MTLTFNPKLLAAISRPGGCYGSELAKITPTYRDELAVMLELGIPVAVGTTPEGRKYAYLDGDVPHLPEASAAEDTTDLTPQRVSAPLEAIAAPAPIPPPATAPPSDAPPVTSAASAAPAAPEVQIAEPDGDYHCRITVGELRISSRPGRGANIVMTPEGLASSSAALQFCQQIPQGAVLDVYLKVRCVRPPDKLSRAQRAKREAYEATAATAPALGPARLADVASPPDELDDDDQEPTPETTPTEKGGDMPIYQYQCPACGQEYEELQSIGDGPAPCPACGTPGERRISAPAKAIIQEHERNPYKKSKQQLSREIDEQIRDNEIPPDLADAQSRLAGL